MSLKGAVEDIIFKIDSSEKTTIFLAFFQALATASAASYTIYANSQIDIARWSTYLFAFFQSTVLLFFVIMLFISGKYRAIKLRLNRNTGSLHDKTTGFINISLRDTTLKIILDGIGNSKKTYEIGKEAGENFYGSFNKEWFKENKYDNEAKLQKWLEYDSSSGLGKFKVLPHTGFPIKLEIISPCMKSCSNKTPNLQCRFLMGYIDGFCSKLYETKLESKCERKRDPARCILTLEP